MPNEILTPTRRQTLALTAGGLIASLIGPRSGAYAAAGDTLTIAYNVNLPSFDPTVGPSAVNPTIQAIYRSVFDQYIGQKPNLAFEPGLLTAWGWNDDKTKIWMDVRPGVTWHDGSPFTPADIVWSFERAGKKETGNPIEFVWSTLGNFKVDGQRVTADMKQFDPTIFKWMAFLTAYVLPKDYFEKVGAEGFEKKPIGTGPYMVDAYQGNAFLRLKANPKYWGGKPAFETVVFKFVTDATSRVAELESGSSDLTLEIPYEEFDRLKAKPGLVGIATPISDIGMIFINSDGKLDKNVRLAAHHAIDKQSIVKRLLRGYGVPIDTLEAPEYEAYDPTIKVPVQPGPGQQAPGGRWLLAAEAVQDHDPDDARLQAEGLRNDPGDRRNVAQGRHRSRYRGLRDRQALRAANQPQAGAAGILQLGQCYRRSVDFDRACHVRPVAALELEEQGPRRHDRAAVGREGRGQAHRGLQGGRPLYRTRGVRDPIAAVRSAHRVQGRPEGDAQRLGRHATHPGHQERVTARRGASGRQ